MNKKIGIFLIKLTLLYIFWIYISEFFVGTRFWAAINSVVLREVMFFSKYLLKFLGFFLDFTVQSFPSNNIKWAPHDAFSFWKGDMTFTSTGHLFIANKCLALDLMYTFSSFIIAFFGPWKKKIWFIAMGIVIINFLNVLRIAGLGISILYFPQFFHFEHHILFTYIVYFFTFILWVIWIMKFANDDILKIIQEDKEMKEKKQQMKVKQNV